MSVLLMQCAWCGKDLPPKDGEGESGTSHGICHECAQKVLEMFYLHKENRSSSGLPK